MALVERGPGPLMFTFDNANLIVSHNLNGRDKTAVVEWDLAGKKETKLIFESKDYDVSNVSYSRKRKVLTMVTWTGAKEERHFLDDQTKAMYTKMAVRITFWRTSSKTILS